MNAAQQIGNYAGQAVAAVEGGRSVVIGEEGNQEVDLTNVGGAIPGTEHDGLVASAAVEHIVFNVDDYRLQCVEGAENFLKFIQSCGKPVIALAAVDTERREADIVNGEDGYRTYSLIMGASSDVVKCIVWLQAQAMAQIPVKKD